MFEIYEPEEIKKPKKIKKASAFDLLKALTINKNLKEINYKPSDCYFILTLMCYNNQLRKYEEPFINRYGKLGNKKTLEILEKILPKKSYFIKRKINKIHDDDLVRRISIFFNVSDKVAVDYLDTVKLSGYYDEFISHFDLGGKV